jgi:hypothetical protein
MEVLTDSRWRVICAAGRLIYGNNFAPSSRVIIKCMSAGRHVLDRMSLITLGPNDMLVVK